MNELGGTLRAYLTMVGCLAAAALMLLTTAFALCVQQTSGGMLPRCSFLHVCSSRLGIAAVAWVLSAVVAQDPSAQITTFWATARARNTTLLVLSLGANHLHANHLHAWLSGNGTV